MSKCWCILRFIRFLCGRGEFVAGVSTPRPVLFLPHCIIFCMRTRNTVFAPIRMTDLPTTIYTGNFVHAVINANLLIIHIRSTVTWCSDTSSYNASAIFRVDVRRQEEVNWYAYSWSWSESRAGNAKFGAIEKTKKKIGGKNINLT
jgi:hypothetical protein